SAPPTPSENPVSPPPPKKPPARTPAIAKSSAAPHPPPPARSPPAIPAASRVLRSPPSNPPEIPQTPPTKGHGPQESNWQNPAPIVRQLVLAVLRQLSSRLLSIPRLISNQ